jgi:serine O-acetyltransferase
VEVTSRVGDVVSTGPLHTMIREDWETSNRCWGHPGLHAIIVYRFGRWARSQPWPARFFFEVLHRLLNVLLIRNVYGTELSVEALIGRRVCIGHHQGVQIPPHCIIGDDTLVRHNVTIGYGGGDQRPEAVPHIGRHVRLGVGCVLMGPITIGDDARIGPNSVVLSDVPPGAVVFVPPGRIMKSPPPRRPKDAVEIAAEGKDLAADPFSDT